MGSSLVAERKIGPMRRTFISCPEHSKPPCVAELVLDEGEGPEVAAPFWASEWMKSYPFSRLIEISHHDAAENTAPIVEAGTDRRRQAYLNRIDELYRQYADDFALTAAELSALSDRIKQTESFLTRKPRLAKAWEKFRG